MEILSVTALSLMMSLLVFWPRIGHFDVPWGSSDMSQYYFVSDLWNGWKFGKTGSVGFPFELDANVYAGLDGVQNSLARVINLISGSPYVGLNTLLFASFPIVALFAYMSLRLMGLRGPLAVALSVSFTFIPYHLARGLNHLHLALLWGLMAGVLLALLIGSGRIAEWCTLPSRRDSVIRWCGLALLVVIAAWSGLYYAAFTLIVCVAALFWRVAHRASPRDLVRESFLVVATAILAGLGVASVLLSRSEAIGGESVGLRDPIDSVTYAGNLSAALFPQPISVFASRYNEVVSALFEVAPQTEGNLTSNFGSWITTACFLIWAIGMIVLSRRGGSEEFKSDSHEMSAGVKSRPSLTFLVLLLVTTLLFFVPWGLGFVAANVITAQVRAWNRLVPLLLLLAVLAAAGVLRFWVPRRGVALILAAVILSVTGLEMVLPWRGIYAFTVDMGLKRTQEVRSYLSSVNAQIPDQCGIFTYPVTQYPNNGPSGPLMDDYDHLYLAMDAHAKPISYGANRQTPASDWQMPFSDGLTREAADELASMGFCVVHLDTGGYQDASAMRANLVSVLGSPIATSATGRMEAYALP